MTDDAELTLPSMEDVKRLPHKKLNPCVKAFGPGPKGVKCKTCAKLIRFRYRGNIYPKCLLRGNARSEASDHKINWPACAKWEEAE